MKPLRLLRLLLTPQMTTTNGFDSTKNTPPFNLRRDENGQAPYFILEHGHQR